MISTRRATLALVPLGVVVSHSLAYLIGHPDGHDRHAALAGHTHLAYLVAMAVPLAVVGVLVAALHGYRGRRVRPSLVTIAAGQAGCFLLLEGIEHAAAGGGVADVFRQPRLWWGLALQLLVAWALAALVRTGAAIGSKLRASNRRWPQPAVAHRLFHSWLGAARPSPSPTSRRGPPVPALL